MADGRRVGKLPQKIIGDQRLPSLVVIDERLYMLLQGSEAVVISLLARIVPDKFLLATSQITAKRQE